ncbi:RNA-binding S4 domain-containing protein [Thalassotalea profundi]|uniref:RNA-binding S4 domain-containing protein n=1 Tax=Thalassotalea profundi TaxID=2036687 RepID=UPI001E3FA1CC|nr:RNA-binding S4 domain-containing protein [Thalassotalea profundi]
MKTPSLEIELATQPIELCKLLKAVDLVSGGGEAKMVISEGYVYVNGELETQKRKKIYHNDQVEFNGECIVVICHAPVEDKPKRKTKPTTANQNNTAIKQSNNSRKKTPQKNKSKTNTANKTEKTRQPINDSSGQRKPINF